MPAFHRPTAFLSDWWLFLPRSRGAAGFWAESLFPPLSLKLNLVALDQLVDGLAEGGNELFSLHVHRTP